MDEHRSQGVATGRRVSDPIRCVNTGDLDPPAGCTKNPVDEDG